MFNGNQLFEEFLKVFTQELSLKSFINSFDLRVYLNNPAVKYSESQQEFKEKFINSFVDEDISNVSKLIDEEYIKIKKSIGTFNTDAYCLDIHYAFSIQIRNIIDSSSDLSEEKFQLIQNEYEKQILRYNNLADNLSRDSRHNLIVLDEHIQNIRTTIVFKKNEIHFFIKKNKLPVQELYCQLDAYFTLSDQIFEALQNLIQPFLANGMLTIISQKRQEAEKSVAKTKAAVHKMREQIFPLNKEQLPAQTMLVNFGKEIIKLYDEYLECISALTHDKEKIAKGDPIPIKIERSPKQFQCKSIKPTENTDLESKNGEEHKLVDNHSNVGTSDATNSSMATSKTTVPSAPSVIAVATSTPAVVTNEEADQSTIHSKNKPKKRKKPKHKTKCKTKNKKKSENADNKIGSKNPKKEQQVYRPDEKVEKSVDNSDKTNFKKAVGSEGSENKLDECSETDESNDLDFALTMQHHLNSSSTRSRSKVKEPPGKKREMLKNSEVKKGKAIESKQPIETSTKTANSIPKSNPEPVVKAAAKSGVTPSTNPAANVNKQSFKKPSMNKSAKATVGSVTTATTVAASVSADVPMVSLLHTKNTIPHKAAVRILDPKVTSPLLVPTSNGYNPIIQGQVTTLVTQNIVQNQHLAKLLENNQLLQNQLIAHKKELELKEAQFAQFAQFAQLQNQQTLKDIQQKEEQKRQADEKKRIDQIECELNAKLFKIRTIEFAKGSFNDIEKIYKEIDELIEKSDYSISKALMDEIKGQKEKSQGLFDAWEAQQSKQTSPSDSLLPERSEITTVPTNTQALGLGVSSASTTTTMTTSDRVNANFNQAAYTSTIPPQGVTAYDSQFQSVISSYETCYSYPPTVTNSTTHNSEKLVTFSQKSLTAGTSRRTAPIIAPPLQMSTEEPQIYDPVTTKSGKIVAWVPRISRG